MSCCNSINDFVFTETQTDSHGRKAIPVHGMQQEVHAEWPPFQAHQDAQQGSRRRIGWRLKNGRLHGRGRTVLGWRRQQDDYHYPHRGRPVRNLAGGSTARRIVSFELTTVQRLMMLNFVKFRISITWWMFESHYLRANHVHYCVFLLMKHCCC